MEKLIVDLKGLWPLTRGDIFEVVVCCNSVLGKFDINIMIENILILTLNFFYEIVLAVQNL